MKQITKRMTRTVAAIAAVFAVAAPMTVQPAAQMITTVASAASLTSADLVKDIKNNPSTYFTISDTTNSDGGYSITGFAKPAAYQNVKLTTLTVPSQIDGKRITRIQGGNSGRYPAPGISDNDVTSIVLSEGIRGLNTNAIGNCGSLKTITLPTSLTTLSYGCVKNCAVLERFYASGNLLNISANFIDLCPKMKDAWSERAAYLMIRDGMDIMTVCGRKIVTDAGKTQKPVMSYELLGALQSSYDKLDMKGAELTDTYYRIYARYLNSQVIGVTDSMSFNEKVKRIYSYVVNRASYDTADVMGDKHYWAGSVFFDTKTVCHGYSMALGYLFREAGIDCYVVDETDYVTSGSGLHTFNVLYYNGLYFIVDGTCGIKGSLMNPTELKRFHNTEAISNWKISSTFVQYPISAAAIKQNLRYALGDVNCDGQVNSKDGAAVKEYIAALSASAKRSVAARYGLTTARFETLGDANCDGKLDTYYDTQAIYNLSSAYGFKY